MIRFNVTLEHQDGTRESLRSYGSLKYTRGQVTDRACHSNIKLVHIWRWDGTLVKQYKPRKARNNV